MIRAVFVLLIFTATFAKSQNCQSSCRVVCDEGEPRHRSLLPGKRGQKGEKGERGRDGPQGTSSPSNTGLVKSIEERVVRLESVLENLPTKYKSKNNNCLQKCLLKITNRKHFFLKCIYKLS